MVADCGYLFGATAALAVLVAVAAWIVGRIVARMKEANAWVILGAIVVSLAVLQVGAKLAVVTVWLYERAGLEPAAACGGQLGTFAFGGTLVIIVAYVGVFFLSFRRSRTGV